MPPPSAGDLVVYRQATLDPQARRVQGGYPVVIDTASAEVRYDNFNGHWGSQSQLDRLMQAYAVEKARLEARRAGHTVTEQPLPDGSIKLTVHVGGAA